MDQRGDQPIDEHQLMAGAGTFGSLADPASRSMATTLGPGLPRLGELLGQARKMLLTVPREQPMRRHRTWHDTSPAVTHQVVRPGCGVGASARA
jgi:hypothetical protein